MQKQLVIFPKGSLDAKDKARLERAGYIAIEAHDPAQVVMPLPAGNITGDMLAMAALDAMAVPDLGCEAVRARTTANLHRRLREREQKAADSSNTPTDAPQGRVE